MTDVDELKPIGWEWASDSQTARVRALLPEERDACPVCGHPTGDCVGGHVAESKQSQASAPEAVQAPAPMEASPPAEAEPLHGSKNRLLEEPNGEAKTVRASSIVDTDGYVKKNVYEEVTAPLAKRKSYRLAYVEGQQLSREQIAALKG